MTLKRGDVVLVEFPFSSGRASKLRPALVVQTNRNNRQLTNVIIAAITTTTHRRGQATQLLIDPATAEGRQSGLLSVSVVTCENLFTVSQELVQRKIGQLPPRMMRQIDSCLKASLNIR